MVVHVVGSDQLVKDVALVLAIPSSNTASMRALLRWEVLLFCALLTF
jgi:hypothetical protein